MTNLTDEEMSVKFVEDSHALKEKYNLSDIEYMAAMAGWFIAFCYAHRCDPAEVLARALDAAKKTVEH